MTLHYILITKKKINLIKGDKDNFKITSNNDLDTF